MKEVFRDAPQHWPLYCALGAVTKFCSLYSDAPLTQWCQAPLTQWCQKSRKTLFHLVVRRANILAEPTALAGCMQLFTENGYL